MSALRLARKIAVCLLAAAGPGMAIVNEARASEPVLLRFKGGAGASYRHALDWRLETAATGGGREDTQRQQAAAMEIATTVTGAGPDGRQRLEIRLARVELRDREGGEVIFDSRDPAHLESARKEPEWGYVLASLAARVRVERAANGKVLAREYDVPGAAGKPELRESASQFLSQAIAPGEYRFPERPVAVGESWPCAEFDIPLMGGDERVVGAARCTLNGVRESDGETAAFIAIVRSGSLRQAPKSPVRVGLAGYAEQGEMRFAVERGVVKYLSITSRMTIEFARAGGTRVTDTRQKAVLREVRR